MEQRVGLYYTAGKYGGAWLKLMNQRAKLIRPNRLDCRKVDGGYRVVDRQGHKSYFNRDDAVVLKGMLEVALKI